MSSFVVRSVAAAAALSVAALSLPQDAEAGRRHHRGHSGDAAAAAIVGFGVGAIVGGAVARDRYYYGPPPPRVYYAPPPAYYYAPGPAAYGPPPWTPDWEAYCYSKYPTFDRYTGTFVARDGYRYFCR